MCSLLWRPQAGVFRQTMFVLLGGSVVTGRRPVLLWWVGRYGQEGRYSSVFAGAEARFDWVLRDVVGAFGEVLGASDEAIPVIGLPELAAALFALVDLRCGEGFPGADDVGEAVRGDGLKENVNMVGHDHVGGDAVAGLVEVLQRGGDDCGIFWVTEQARAGSLVEPLFNLVREAVLVIGSDGGGPWLWVEVQPDFFFAFEVAEF